MLDLGRIDDLPKDYVDTLTKQNLVPLWPSLRALLPPKKPIPTGQPTLWKYNDIYDLLIQAGSLTPIEKAERRVLVLANPGYGLEKMQATPAIYLGMQLLLPGEWAPSHKHTPNAVRMIVDGKNAFTTVDGEKCPMNRGDLILTPTGLWHEHTHEGDGPVIWLDVLDLPLAYYMEASYHINGVPEKSEINYNLNKYCSHGIRPHESITKKNRYPMLRYPWDETRASLKKIASDNPDLARIQVTYINPETGDYAENILGFYALMLRPKQILSLPAQSPSCVYHLIEGNISINLDGNVMQLSESDTACVPGYTPTVLKNNSDNASFIFIADESPLHKKLGFFEIRD